MMPRHFLFGTIEVPMWDYYWGLTAAQVEILKVDQPTVVYKKDEEKSAPWKNGTVTESYANKQYEKWLEKKKMREKSGRQLNIDKVLSGGKRIDLEHFVSTGEKKEV